MKNMFRLMSLFFLTASILLLAGCGKDSPSVKTDENREGQEKSAENLISEESVLSGREPFPSSEDSSSVSADNPSSADPSTLHSDEPDPAVPGPLSPVQDIKEATAASPGFQMADQYYPLGEVTIADLLSDGAEFEPDGTVTSPDFMEEPGKERSLTLSLYGKPFLVTAVNQSAQPSAIKNSDITAIYASQPELFAPGGIRPGDPVDDLILSLGEPFQVVNGAEIDSSYGHLNVYYYSSRWDDKNLAFFADADTDTIISFREQMPTGYLTHISQVSEEQIRQLISEHDSSSRFLSTPYILDVDGSEYGNGILQDVVYRSAKLYTLDSIHDPETFNRDITDIASCVPLSLLVVEFEGTVAYSDEDMERFAFIGKTLDYSYQVHGCFYILNPVANGTGEIENGIGLAKIRDMKGVYKDTESMYAGLFTDREQGYSLEDYSVSSQSLK